MTKERFQDKLRRILAGVLCAVFALTTVFPSPAVAQMAAGMLARPVLQSPGTIATIIPQPAPRPTIEVLAGGLVAGGTSFRFSGKGIKEAELRDFEYTTGGLVSKETEPKGNFFTHEFDANGRITYAMDEEGAQDQFSHAFSALTGAETSTVTGAEGNAMTFVYQAGPRQAFDAQMSVTGVTNPTLSSLSSDGLVARITRPDLTQEEYRSALDPENKFEYLKAMTVTVPSGLQAGLAINRSYADTNLDGIADVVTVTQSLNGKTATLTHNTLTGQVTASSPMNRGMVVTYDTATLLTSAVHVPGLTDTAYLYDARGRLTDIQTGTRHAIYAYDSAGNVASYRDPKNQVTTYEYDSVGRTTAIHRPDGTTVGFTYDLNGNLTTLTNPASVAHTFTYNKENLTETYQPPVSALTRAVYDHEKRLKRVEFPSGKQIVDVYTGTLLTQVQLPAGEGNVDLTYLASGQVATVSHTGETLTYGYDGMLPTSLTSTGTLAQAVSYAYNTDFQVTGVTYAGSTQALGYDTDGLLTSSGIFALDHDAQNGLPTHVYIYGVWDLYRGFNGYGEVISENTLKHTSPSDAWSLAHWEVTRDDNGQITTKSETVNGVTANYSYTYDAQGRLLTVQKDGTLVEEYQYNNAPNPGLRTYELNTLRGIVPGRSLTYNTEDQLLSVGGTTYFYNTDGYLAQKSGTGGTTTYTYSTRGELLTAALPDTRVISYVYDPLGRRIAKKINGTITEKYLWAGLTRLLAVYDGSDNLLMRFEYVDGRMPYLMTRLGATYYLVYDQVGTLKAVFDANGALVKRVDYDTFGNILTDTAPTFTVPFGFAGGLHDRDTGLVHFGYRDYDPATGRWTAKDPIGFDGGDVDVYGYVENDPVNWVDPMGLHPYWPWSPAPLPIKPFLQIPPDGPLSFGRVIPPRTVGHYCLLTMNYMGDLVPYIGLAGIMAEAYAYGGWLELIEGSLFRFDPTGRWKGGKGPHIHFDPTASGRLMGHHLPYQFRTWWEHLLSLIGERWQNLWRRRL